MLDRLQGALSEGRKAGADGVELFAATSEQLSIKYYQGKVERLTRSDSQGIGARAFVGGRVGYAFTADLEAGKEMIRVAVANASQATPDTANVLPQAAGAGEPLALLDERLPAASLDAKIDLLSRTEKAADRPNVRPHDHSYQEHIAEVAVVNSAGVATSYRAGFCSLSSFVLAERDGEVQSGWDLSVGRSTEDLDSSIGERSAQRAHSLLGARRIPSERASVLLDPLVAAQLIGVLGRALTAESAQKGRSPFGGSLGEAVASECVSLVDDAREVEGVGASPVDDEGVPTGRTTLIDRGVLTGFLHNSQTAARAGAQSTGNAQRGSHRNIPGVSPSNLLVLPGEPSREQLIGQVERGLLVLEVSGVHSGANPVSGEISLGAKGLWIEKGTIAYPVREVAIAGQLQQLLLGVEAVGSDFRLSPIGGSCGTPTLFFREMSLSGT